MALLIAVSASGFIVYLTSILNVNKKLIHRLIIGLWIVFLFFAGVHILKNRAENNLRRITCVPQNFSDESIVMADWTNETLRQSSPADVLVFPLDWTSETLQTDSLADVDYLISYGRRLNLDGLCVVSTDDQHVRWRWYAYSDDAFVFDVMVEKQDDFSSAATAVLHPMALTAELDSLKHITFPKKMWASLGAARRLQLTHHYLKAETAFQQVVRMDPYWGYAHLALARTLLDRLLLNPPENPALSPQFIQTEEIISDYLSQNPRSAEALLLQGRLFMQMKLWNRAARSMLKSHEINSWQPEFYYHFSHFHKSRLKEAGFASRKGLIRKALRLNPGYVQAALKLGDIYYQALEYDEAEASYRWILNIDPHAISALLALGRLYTVQNDVPALIQTYEKVLALDNQNPEAYYNLGIAYYHAQRLDEAARFFERALSLRGHANSHFYLGMILARQGDLKMAIEHFRQRLKLRTSFNDPHAEEARKALYNLLNFNTLYPE